MLHRSHSYSALLAGLGLLVALTVNGVRAQDKPSASQPSGSDEVNLGVDAYQAAHYDQAIVHFRRAVELEPSLLLAKTYLATALAQSVVPDVNTPANLKLADEAIGLFNQALAVDPHDVNSMKQIAGLYYSTQRHDDARMWQKKVLQEDPKDADAAYTIGVIDWYAAHENALKALQAAGLKDDGEGNAAAPPDLLANLRKQNAALVEEALTYLNQAVAIRPDYDDAMAYLNVTYRRKADLDFEDPKARDEDVAKAQEWMRKTTDTRKANEGKSGASSGSGSSQN